MIVKYAVLDSETEVNNLTVIAERKSVDESQILIKYYNTNENDAALSGVATILSYEEALALVQTPVWELQL